MIVACTCMQRPWGKPTKDDLALRCRGGEVTPNWHAKHGGRGGQQRGGHQQKRQPSTCTLQMWTGTTEAEHGPHTRGRTAPTRSTFGMVVVGSGCESVQGFTDKTGEATGGGDVVAGTTDGLRAGSERRE